MTTNSSLDSLKLVLIGDLFLGGVLPPFLTAHRLGFDYPFEHIRSEFVDADFVFVNLESPLSEAGRPRADKDFVLRAPPEAIVSLKALNVSVACLGNNHIYDYGEAGLESTIALLRQNQIALVGAGRNQEQSSNPLVLDVNGYATTIMACVDCPSAILATAQRGGVTQCNRASLLSGISEAKKHSDLVLVSLHWGKEGYSFPAPGQVRLAHEAVDAGADVIFGHHPHVVQGFEKYKQGIIFYSLGNFYFPDFQVPNWGGFLQQWPASSRRGFLARLELDAGGFRGMQLVPVYTDDTLRVRLMVGEERDAYLAEVEDLSARLGDADYPRFWRAYDADQSLRSQVSPVSAIWQRIRQRGLTGIVAGMSPAKLLRFGRAVARYVRLQAGSWLKQVMVRLDRKND